jgi:hypothetical protein
LAYQEDAATVRTVVVRFEGFRRSFRISLLVLIDFLAAGLRIAQLPVGEVVADRGPVLRAHPAT